MTERERVDLAHWVIQKAQKQGAADVKVRISKSRDVEVELRKGQLEKLQESSQSSLSLNLYVDHRYSIHSTNDLRKATLEKFIEKTVSMTRYLTPDPYRTLPDPALYRNRPDFDLQIFDPVQAGLESKARIQIARELEAVARNFDKRVLMATAEYSDGFGESTRVFSNGFEGHRVSTYFSAGVQVTVQDKNEKRPEDWFYATTRHFADLWSPEKIGQLAAQRALDKLGMKKVSSRKCTMLVENRAAGRLISALLGPLSGRALQQKQSFLEGMLEQPVAGDKLTMIDDPFVVKGLSSRLFDGEGISAKKFPIIEQGILKTYFIDTYYGKKLEMKPTFSSHSNIIFEPGEQNLEEMIAATGQGFLVKSFLGGNSNSTTGDFSFGFQGVLIENGKRIHPVNEMNISGNLKQIFMALSAVGNDPNPFSSMRCPSLRFEEVSFSGI